MKLTRKLTIAFVLAMVFMLTANTLLRLRREVALFETDIRTDGHVLGRAIGAAVTHVWDTGGEAAAMELVEHANRAEGHVLIRWVWLDAPPGSPTAPTAPSELLVDARAGREQVLRLSAPGAEFGAIHTLVPLTVPGGRRGALELVESLDQERAYLLRTISRIAFTTLATVLLFAALAWALGVRLVGRPIQMLVDKARRIGQGDLTGDLTLPPSDEIGVLAAEMNAMCAQLAAAHRRTALETEQRLAALAQLRHADRLMMVGKLASGLAHELGTPLNVISGRAELIREVLPPDSPAHEDARIIAEYARRMAGIIRQLLDFARRTPAQRSIQDVCAMVRQTAEMLSTLATRSDARIILSEPEHPVPVNMDRPSCSRRSATSS